MRIKMFTILAVLGLVVAGTAMAKGQVEEQSGLPWKTVTLTGSVSFNDWPNPEITVRDGKTYELLVPRLAVVDLEVTEGQTITVEGYAIEGTFRGAPNDRQYIRVVKAVIDGEEYTLPDNMRMNPAGGKRGGRDLAPRGAAPDWGDAPNAGRGR